jgi:hypothetical protein
MIRKRKILVYPRMVTVRTVPSKPYVSGTNKLSALVANKLSGFQTIPRRYRNEADRLAARDKEDEI